MAWIQSHQTIAGHPKTRKLAHMLNISKPAAIGHLHCFWWWALDYADDGDLSDLDALDIAIGAEWEGDPEAFFDAMVFVGFIDVDDAGDTQIHDWHDYAGKLVDRRKANAERMRKARANDTDDRAAHVQRTQRARVELEKSREEKSREEGEDSVGAAAPKPHKPKRATQVPEDFHVTDALDAWAAKNEFTREQMEAQIPRFIDHYRAKGEPRKDWHASFQNWMRNARDFGHLSPRNHHNGKHATENPFDVIERELQGAPPENVIDARFRRTS